MLLEYFSECSINCLFIIRDRKIGLIYWICSFCLNFSARRTKDFGHHTLM